MPSAGASVRGHCLQCGHPFGLVRRGVDAFIPMTKIKIRLWDSRFCSTDCEASWRKADQQNQRRDQFLAWLGKR